MIKASISLSIIYCLRSSLSQTSASPHYLTWFSASYLWNEHGLNTSKEDSSCSSENMVSRFIWISIWLGCSIWYFNPISWTSCFKLFFLLADSKMACVLILDLVFPVCGSYVLRTIIFTNVLITFVFFLIFVMYNPLGL